MILEEVKSFKFPAGEIQVILDDAQYNDYIYANIQNSDDIIKLLLATDAYKRKYNKTPKLYLPYIPYARQDRVCNNGESLSIKVFTDLINLQNYPIVYVLDSHSDVATSLINNVKAIDNVPLAQKVWDNIKQDDLIILAPDAGALKKTYKIAKSVKYNKEVIFCEKQRNVKTGEITGTKIYSDNIENNNFIIFDDICDGGRTFIEIAKVLKSQNANKIILVISHGIFSKGLEVLFEYIDEIYCTDSFKKIPSCDNFYQYSALELMKEEL